MEKLSGVEKENNALEKVKVDAEPFQEALHPGVMIEWFEVTLHKNWDSRVIDSLAGFFEIMI